VATPFESREPRPTLPLLLRVTFAVAVVLMIAIAAVSYQHWKTLLEASAWVIHSHEVRGSLSQILSSVEAAETAERGFIITGDESYVAPHNNAQRSVPEEVRHLRALVKDNEEQRWRLNGLEPHVDKLLAWLRDTIETRRQNRAAANQRVGIGTGTAELQAVREGIRSMDAAENAVLRRRVEDLDAAARTAAVTFGFAAFSVVALIAVLYAAVRRHERERHALLLQEEAARRSAEAADRAKDAFLATVSHELRTPLSPIVTWAEVLKRGNLDEEQFRTAVDSIQRSARAQTQLIEDLLDLSRIVSGRMRLEVRSVDLGDVIKAAADIVGPAAEAKGIRLQTVIDTETAPVSGDPDRLQQVVWNLLTNAVKFTPRGGRVTAVLRRVDSHAEISVSDTGRGISAELLPFVFEPFRQEIGLEDSNKRAAGLGLGLAIVRHLVEAHGGTVKGESAGPGQGSTFTVSLPLMAIGRIVDATKEDAPSAQRYLSIESLRVLVVDDEPDSNESVRTLLASYGADVRVAESATQALDVVAKWVPDVVVTDIGMPGMDGYGLLKRIRERDPHERQMPVIALTAFAGIDERVRLLSAGFQMHVAKPVDPNELLAVIANVVATRGDGRA